MVIQRWQSVLLFIAAAVMACFTFLPIGQITTADYTFSFTGLGFFQEGIPTDGATTQDIHTWYFFMMSLTTVVILLIDIFLFNNLPFQKKICLVGILFIIATGAVAGCLGFTAIEGGNVGWSTVALCPFIALFAAIMAYNRMSSDQKKLRSADRLR